MIPESQTIFDQYLNPHQTVMGEGNFSDDELKEALRNLKKQKSGVWKYFFECGKWNFTYIFEIYSQSFATTWNISGKPKICEGVPIYKKDEEFLWEI